MMKKNIGQILKYLRWPINLGVIIYIAWISFHSSRNFIEVITFFVFLGLIYLTVISDTKTGNQIIRSFELVWKNLKKDE